MLAATVGQILGSCEWSDEEPDECSRESFLLSHKAIQLEVKRLRRQTHKHFEPSQGTVEANGCWVIHDQASSDTDAK